MASWRAGRKPNSTLSTSFGMWDIDPRGRKNIRAADPGRRNASLLWRDKCELILTAGATSTVDVGLYPPDFKVIRDGNFELLGGPIGSPAFCNQHTQVSD